MGFWGVARANTSVGVRVRVAYPTTNYYYYYCYYYYYYYYRSVVTKFYSHTLSIVIIVDASSLWLRNGDRMAPEGACGSQGVFSRCTVALQRST
jgi:hypothetical protein